MPQRWTLDTHHKINAFVEFVTEKMEGGDAQTVEFMKPHRSTAQNAMFYALYRDIADQLKDKSIIEVKRECKLRFGVVIRKGRDQEWAEFYDRSIKPMSYEDKLLLMDDYPITSKFNKEEGTEYIKTILEEYQRLGIYIPDPREEAVS